MRRIFLCTVAIALTAVLDARSENAVRFTNASAQPGETFTIEILVENDVVLGGGTIPFRWSSSSITLESVVPNSDRWEGKLSVLVSPVNQPQQTSGLTFIASINPDEPGWVPVGDGSIATLHFRVSPSAQPMYVFIDSAYEVSGIFVRRVEWSDYPGQLVIPEVHSGVITIGNPDAANLIVAPESMFGRGESGVSNVPVGTLDIDSDSELEISWTATWNSEWLRVSPPDGKTPAAPLVSADAFTLLAGNYYDTIAISSRLSTSPPTRIPITLQVDSLRADTLDDVHFQLLQSRPNPFVTYNDPDAMIPFRLDRPDQVKITVYNLLGQVVRNLVQSDYAAGEYNIVWDGRGMDGESVASGVYLCRMTTSQGAMARAIVVIK